MNRLKCNKCHVDKPGSKFYRRSDGKTLYSDCKDCHRAYQAKRRKELPDYHRSRYLKRYGLTIEQYKSKLKKQNNVCAICFGKQTRALSVDHHHGSGVVRELLCGSCNALIGLAKENVQVLARSILYLQKHENAARRKKDAIKMERKIKRIRQRNEIILSQARAMRDTPVQLVPADYVLMRHVGILNGREFVGIENNG